jgi:xylose isomerase
MAEIFKGLPTVTYAGPGSKDPLTFKFYDPDRIILGKPMREHLPFAMAWWHNLTALGADMFGAGTADKRFGAQKPGTMEHARAKVDAGFEFMQKLGIGYFCFHDLDLVPEADTLEETNRRLDEISDYILEKMNEPGIRNLWGTANLFSNLAMPTARVPRTAGRVPARRAQVIKAIDITVKLVAGATCSGAGARATKRCSTPTCALNRRTSRA